MKRIVIISFYLIIVGHLMAQSVQLGVVKEYNEKKQKTPLSGVELIIKNAGSCISDKKGLFTLKFRTLKPGDRVEYSRIEKSGYEIFNKDAVEEWRIANDGSTFTIVLCKSSKFKVLKDRYNAIASKSYAEQQKQEMTVLEGQLKAGKIQKAEYERKLNELKNYYDEQLENLDNYIDRFARIDLSELSKEEQKIIDLVNDGKIGEAISAYENLGLESQYIQAQSNISEAENAIRQLNKVKDSNNQILSDTYSAIMRMNDVRRLQGGEENYRKIGETLKLIMETDTMNFKNVSAYAEYLLEQNYHINAIHYLLKALNLTDDKENKVLILQRLGNEYMRVGKMDESERCLRQSEFILDSIQHQMNDKRKRELYSVVYCFLADVYSRSHNTKLSEDYYKKTLDILSSDNIAQKDIDRRITTMSNLGNLYAIELSRFKDALAVLNKADSLLIATYGMNLNEKHLRQLGVIKQTIATALGCLKNYDEAYNYFSQAVEIASKLTQMNPQANRMDELYIYNNWGTLLLREKKYENAENCFKMAYNLACQANEETPSLYNKLLTLVIGGALANSQTCQPVKWQEGKDLLDRILPEMIMMYEQNKQVLTPYLSILYSQYAYTLMHHSDYKEALDAIDKAIALTPDNADLYDGKGEILYNSGEIEAAKVMWSKVIELNPNYLESSESELYNLLFNNSK